VCVEVQKYRGSSSLGYIKQIVKDQGCNSYEEIKRNTNNRKVWRIANQSWD